MAGAYERAQAIVAALVAAGVRATVDPSAINPPAVLVVPPNRRYDLACGFTASWTAVALVPSAQGTDRVAFSAHEALVDEVTAVVGVVDTEVVTYPLNGTNYLASLCRWSEAI